MGERIRPTGDNTQGPIQEGEAEVVSEGRTREEKARIARLSDSFQVTGRILSGLAKADEKGIDLGRLTPEAILILKRAAQASIDRSYGRRSPSPAAVDPSTDAARDVSRNGSITENQPSTAEKPLDIDPDPAATRILAGRKTGPRKRTGPPPKFIFANHTRKADPDSDRSVPAGCMTLGDVAAAFGVTGDEALEIIKQYGVHSVRDRDTNWYPEEQIEEIKRERDAKEISDCHPAHHWLIESPNGPKSPGLCKYCGETKEFESAYEGW